VGARRASEDSEQPWAVEIRDAAISRDGAAVVYLDGVDVSFWSPGEGNPRVLGTYEGDPPRYVAISPDGRFALSSGGDRQIHLWRLSGRPNPYREKIRAIKREREQLQRELGLRPNNFDPEASYRPDSRDKPSSVVFAGQNDAVVTTGDGSLFAVVIHDDPSGPRLEGSRLEGRHNVSRIVMDPQRRIFVTSSHDGSTRVWSFDKHCTSAVLNAHPGTVQQLSASADRILMNTRDGIVNIVELGDGSLVAAFQGDRQIASSDCDAELRHVVALDQGGQMHFLHLEPD
jgi:WD40 repeat protein